MISREIARIVCSEADIRIDGESERYSAMHRLSAMFREVQSFQDSTRSLSLTMTMSSETSPLLSETTT